MRKNTLVTIILVNYNGRNFLEQCLNSLEKLDFPKSEYDVLVVDNNSWDNSVEYIRTYHPQVRLIESPTNLGFAAGNNLGVRSAKGKYVVLLNNDTVVEPQWLSALVRRIESKDAEDIAAVNGKSLLYYPFLNIRVASDVYMRSEFTDSADFQQVGVLLERVILADRPLQHLVHQRAGFYQREIDFPSASWTNGNGQLLIPIDPFSEEVAFILTIRAQKTNSELQTNVSIMIDDTQLVTDKLSSYQVKQYVLRLPKKLVQKHRNYVVQNAGNAVFKDGYVRDIGSAVKKNIQTYELDSAYFKTGRDILAFCGTNVLIKKNIYEELGGFDETFFMYYEDADFSLRCLRKGYRIVYEPNAIIHHIHSGTSSAKPSFVSYHAERNHLLLLVKHFPWKIVCIQSLIHIMSFIVSSLRAMIWGFKGNLIKSEFWQDKSQYRFQLLVWSVRNLPSLYRKRLAIIKTQKYSLENVFSRLY